MNSRERFLELKEHRMEKVSYKELENRLNYYYEESNNLTDEIIELESAFEVYTAELAQVSVKDKRVDSLLDDIDNVVYNYNIVSKNKSEVDDIAKTIEEEMKLFV